MAGWPSRAGPGLYLCFTGSRWARVFSLQPRWEEPHPAGVPRGPRAHLCAGPGPFHRQTSAAWPSCRHSSKAAFSSEPSGPATPGPLLLGPPICFPVGWNVFSPRRRGHLGPLCPLSAQHQAGHEPSTPQGSWKLGAQLSRGGAGVPSGLAGARPRAQAQSPAEDVSALTYLPQRLVLL